MAHLIRCLVPASVVVLALSFGACRPFAEIGQSCIESPCAAGLRCDEGVCVLDPPPPPPPPLPPPPCASDEECTLNGSADGRECLAGECIWSDCAFDAQCGTRICDLGLCAERRVCLVDDDCKDGGICIDGACRSPCEDDAQCGGFLQTCLDGRCEQSCFIDLMCLGDICEGGICTTPECGDDADCGVNEACASGRCEGYTPCLIDDDCFDPNYFCNELDRCELRPACDIDADCAGVAICRAGVCRDTEPCLVDGDCPDPDDECVANRCVGAPDCRFDGDCGANQACVNNGCVAFTVEPAADVVLTNALGPCFSNGEGACELVLVVGETTLLSAAGFDSAGAPVRGDLSFAPLSLLFADVTGDADALVVTALSPGETALVVEDAGGFVSGALKLTVVPAATTEALRVLVIDAQTGAPVVGAAVVVGDQSATTSAVGLASFATTPGPDTDGVTALVVDATGYRGLVGLDGVLSGDVRVALASTAAPTAVGITARSLSSGDETGPVGTGVVLGACSHVGTCGLADHFLPAFPGALEVPLFGALDVALPRTVTLEATIPLVGTQQSVREFAYVTTTDGYPQVTALEGRDETNALFNVLFGGAADAVAFTLDLARRAEGMDAKTVAIGRRTREALVFDDADLDADGDTGELIPAFTSSAPIDVTPEQLPRERVGLTVGAPPSIARAELFAVLGLELPGTGLVPIGIGALSGGATEQVKCAPPASAGLSRAGRVARVEALFDDGGTAVVVARGEAFSTEVVLPAFLPRPDGAFLLFDVPSPGTTSLVLPEAPGATTFAIRVNSANGERDVVVAAGEGGTGRTVALPASLTSGPLFIVEVTVAALPGPSAASATSAVFSTTSGPYGALVARASSYATTPAP